MFIAKGHQGVSSNAPKLHLTTSQQLSTPAWVGVYLCIIPRVIGVVLRHLGPPQEPFLILRIFLSRNRLCCAGGVNPEGTVDFCQLRNNVLIASAVLVVRDTPNLSLYVPYVESLKKLGRPGC
jgi:hypothetical protein